jgi:hypothetical protein
MRTEMSDTGDIRGALKLSPESSVGVGLPARRNLSQRLNALGLHRVFLSGSGIWSDMISEEVGRMPLDDGDVDFYTPEEKREMLREAFPPSKPSAWSSFKESVAYTAGSVMLIGVWIVTALVVLVVGIAVVKWAIEELAK